MPCDFQYRAKACSLSENIAKHRTDPKLFKAQSRLSLPQDCIRALRKAGVFDTGAFEQQTVAATTAEPPSPLPRALAPASPGRAVKSGGGSRPPSPRKGPTDPTRTAGGGRPGSPARHPSPPHVDYAPFLWSPATQIRSPRLQNTEEVAVQTSPGMGAIGPPRPPSRSRGLGRQQNENRGWENLVGVGMGSGADAVGAKKAAALAALGPQGRFTAWAKGDRGLASERVEGVPSPSRGEGRTPQLLLGSPRKQLGLETVISSRPENLQVFPCFPLYPRFQSFKGALEKRASHTREVSNVSFGILESKHTFPIPIFRPRNLHF